MDEEIEQEMKIGFSVVLSYAITDPLAMMIHPIYTDVASPTMVISGGLNFLTNLAYEELLLRNCLLFMIFLCYFFEYSV